MKREPTRIDILKKIFNEFFLATTEINRDGGGILVHLSRANALIDLLFVDNDYDAPLIRVTGYRPFDQFLATIKKYHNYKDLNTDCICVADLIHYYKSIQREMQDQVITNILKYGKKTLEVVKNEFEEVISGKTERVINLIDRYRDEIDDYTNAKKAIVLNRLIGHNDFTKEEISELTTFFQNTIDYPAIVGDSRKSQGNFRIKYSKTQYSEESFRGRKLAEKFLRR